MLPATLPYSALLAPTETGEQMPLGTGLALPIGIAEADLRPVLLDFAGDPHLYAFGDSESGKSSLLRGLAESLIRRFTPEQARIVLVDYRRSLLTAIGTDHLIGYGTRPTPPSRWSRPSPRTCTSAGPGPTSRRNSCATGRGGPGRSASCWWTTTTWWPPARPTRYCRCSTTSRRPATSACTWC
jgi:S-DNA-T family DNA segregation ATPase FtsK/SpoIIIE